MVKDLKKLVQHKKALKKKTPDFSRQESHRRKRLGDKWRSPKGVHSKLRLKRRGKKVGVSIGYKSPVLLRHADEQGRLPILINNISELKAMDSKQNFAILSSRVGSKKKMEILEEAKKLKISFSNVKDLDAEIKKIQQRFSLRKEAKKTKAESKKKREEERKKKEKAVSEKKKKAKVEKIEKAAEAAGATVVKSEKVSKKEPEKVPEKVSEKVTAKSEKPAPKKKKEETPKETKTGGKK